MTDIEPYNGAAPDVAGLVERVDAARAHAEQLAESHSALAHGDWGDAVAHRDTLNRMRDEMDSAHAALESATADLAAAFEAQLEVARRSLEPLQRKTSELMSAVQAISLYLGSDEQVVLLREGNPAPADTPIYVYQTTLFMDEEMALAAEAAGLADATIDPGAAGWSDFDAWLCADERHVDQVCPSRRGVVALRSARVQRRNVGTGGDGSELTHLLVRNGEQLAWVVASTEFSVGDRLIPERNEFEKFFTDQFSTDAFGNPAPLKVGTPAWERAQRLAKGAQQHYLKIALILQGIVDRSPLLSPLPSDQVSFTAPDSYDAGHIVAVVEDDGSRLPSGVLAFPQWRRRIVADLSEGQRVVLGHIPVSELRGSETQGIRAVLHPKSADHPPTGEPLVVKRRAPQEFSVSFRRTDTVWKRNQPVPDKPGYVYSTPMPVPASGYASVSFTGSEDWVLPIDHPLVTIEAIDWYLTSRENRRHFQSMIPLLRSARRALAAEAEAEAPFRELAVSETVRLHGVTSSDAASVVGDAIRWWKTKKRRHRALLDGSSDEAAAFTEVLAEVGARLRVRELVDDPGVVDRIRRQFPDVVYIGRKRDGTYVSIVAADDRDVYVHVTTWSPSRGTRRPTLEWVVAPDVRGWKPIFVSSRFASWPRCVDVSQEATGPEMDALVALLRAEVHSAFSVTGYDYWGWNGFTRDLQVHSLGPAPEFDHSRPLTGTVSPGQVISVLWGWERSNGDVVLADRGREPSSSAVRASGWDPPTGAVWWSDPAAAAVIASYRDAWVAHNDAADPFRRTAAAAAERLGSAWSQRAVEAEYSAFVAKYGADAKGRWDVHRKVVTSRLRFPHGHGPVRRLLDRAAELRLLPREDAVAVAVLADELRAADPAAAELVDRLDGVLDDIGSLMI